VFDDVLYHFSRRLVEENFSRLHANAFHQTKMFLRAKENENCATKQEISKI
jgi:hypothetical protein